MEDTTWLEYINLLVKVSFSLGCIWLEEMVNLINELFFKLAPMCLACLTFFLLLGQGTLFDSIWYIWNREQVYIVRIWGLFRKFQNTLLAKLIISISIYLSIYISIYLHIYIYLFMMKEFMSPVDHQEKIFPAFQFKSMLVFLLANLLISWYTLQISMSSSIAF